LRSSKNNISNFLFIIFLIALSTVLVGLAIILYSGVFEYLSASSKARFSYNPYFGLIITPALFWVSAYLCRRFSPNSSGGNLKHIKDALDHSKPYAQNPKKISVFLSFKSAAISAVSSLICVFGGGALGREAPAVYISASIFAGIATKFKKIIPQINMHNWIFAGSAIGLAAAFTAPIAGFAYVVEKVLKNRQYNLKTNLVWTLLVVLIFEFFLRQGKDIMAIKELAFSFEDDRQMTLIILISIICGLTAYLFKHLASYLRNKLVETKSKNWYFVPVIAGILVAIISIYSGESSFGGGLYATQEALSGNLTLSYKEVLGRISNTLITFVSGPAGGMVAPAINIGAGIAAIIGELFAYSDTKILILVGMSAFLAIILGEPVTSAIVIFEITDQPISNLPFLIFASLIAIAVGKIIRRLS
jgi:H+/Cl- antiporter ClcA